MIIKQKKLVLVLSVAAIVFCCLATSVPKLSAPENAPAQTGPLTPTPPQFKEHMAQIKCERFVKERLKAPSTARFYNTKTYGREGRERNYHAVLGQVESQNALGVPLVSSYRCDVHYLPNSPGEWVLDKLELE